MRLLQYILIFVCFIPVFLFRDFTPNNELKYLSIADEAIRNRHLFTFWNHGSAYADKPPLYLWIVMAGKWLFNAHSMFFLGLFSIIPALIVLYIMDKWTAAFIPANLRYSGQLMLVTSGLFAGSALVLRMDMLMCMFIVLSLYTFYRLYSGEARRIDRILLPVYIFLAVFSKGPVGILVPLLSIVGFLLVKHDIRSFGKYLGWKEFAILTGLCLLWFGAVYAEGGRAYLNNLLFNQTVNRAIDSFHHKEPFWYYLKTIWYSLAPWVLFYIVTIAIAIRKKRIRTDIEKLFLTIITTTLIALSAFSGKLDIYLLPIFPFIAYLAFLLLPQINDRNVYFTIAIPGILLTFVFPAILIIPRYMDFPVFNYTPVITAALLLSVFSLVSIILLLKKHLVKSANMISYGILLAILTGAFAIPKLNNYIGFGNLAYEAAKISEARNIHDFYFYQFRSGENIDSYLEKEIKNTNSEELLSLSKNRNFILFVRNKELENDPELKKITDNKEIYPIGNYSIILFYLN